ncbi:SET domain-containing protein [Ophiocordyceps camponoti-floridani]|uniref:SET domain-containing protein n=1 Tax=Ophiocordyceps camponoti-floridani TaxID=2030778 RepID=A0A8H4Q2Y3_9HYPO|nr:SET domain-containing protein [Ophiocordyceps camponoti-floridani]
MIATHPLKYGWRRKKLDDDWIIVSSGNLGIKRPDFVYAWMLVNSRTFYHTTPRTEHRLPKEDHMALVPVADLFNHSSSASTVKASYDATSYTFTTTRAHSPGQELLLCYGNHSNDTLLVDYGFTLPANPHDETTLDTFILPLLTPQQSRRLRRAGFGGPYVLDGETPCYRTVTALRFMALPATVWDSVLDGSRDEDEDAAVVDERLGVLLTDYETEIRRQLELVSRLDDDDATPDQKACLRARWIAIREMVLANLTRLRR